MYVCMCLCVGVYVRVCMYVSFPGFSLLVLTELVCVCARICDHFDSNSKFRLSF